MALAVTPMLRVGVNSAIAISARALPACWARHARPPRSPRRVFATASCMRAVLTSAWRRAVVPAWATANAGKSLVRRAARTWAGCRESGAGA